jgi:hypothetical protein
MEKRPRPAFGPGRSLATDTVQNLFSVFSTPTANRKKEVMISFAQVVPTR